MKPEIHEIIKKLTANNSYDSFLFESMEVLDDTPIFKCLFHANKHIHTNVYDSIHGGIFSGLVDLLGGIVITLDNIDEQMELFQRTGKLIKEVSTDINISYLSSAVLGDVLYCEAKVLKKGRNLAFTQVDIYNNKDRSTIIVSGRHTKFIAKHKL